LILQSHSLLKEEGEPKVIADFTDSFNFPSMLVLE